MEISIIIVSYNVKYFLQHCLYAASKAVQDIKAEIIVIDNCSVDGSMDYLKPIFPKVHFIQNEKNTGFARANNLAQRQASGKYILYLNPDTLIAEDTLHNCLYFFEQHKDCGATCVYMMDGGGRFLPESKRAFPTPITAFYKLFFLEKLFPESRKFGRYALGYLDKNKCYPVDVMCGAFIFAKASLIKYCGGFDERYFMYGEDIDLSYCLQEQGLKNYYLGNNPIVHFKGESIQKGSAKQIKIFYEAMALFADKYYGSKHRRITSFILKTAISVRAALSTLKQPVTVLKKRFLPDTLRLAHEIAVVGDMLCTKRAAEIYLKNFPQVIIQYYKTLEEIPTHIPVVVLCIGNNFTYKKAICWLQKNKTQKTVFWYYYDANCIIGSQYKRDFGKILI